MLEELGPTFWSCSWWTTCFVRFYSELLCLIVRLSRWLRRPNAQRCGIEDLRSRLCNLQSTLWLLVSEEMVNKVEPKGLPNEDGNLCYRNAVLSVLLQLNPFTQWLGGLDHKKIDLQGRHQTVRLLSKLAWTCGHSPLEVAPALSDLWQYVLCDHSGSVGRWPAYKPHDTTTQLQDAQDFLDQLLVNIQDTWDPDGANSLQNDTFHNLLLMDIVTESWCSLQCLKYKNMRICRTDRQRFLYLKPNPLNAVNDVSAAISNDFELHVDGPCRYCLKGSRSISRRVKSFPEILFVVIGRSKDQVTPRTAMHIPRALELGQFLSADATGTVSKSSYELSAVISFAGKPDCGHYISYVRQAESNQWFRFDDEVVSFSMVDIVNKDPIHYEANSTTDELVTGYKYSPYILTYTKRHA